MKKIKKEHGITLVALVITIVVLLILAGISIQAITQNNLFEQAKKAKNATENSQKEENKTLSEYMGKINEYLPETLSYKVSNGEIAIGAYVKYIPDAIDVNSKEYKNLLSNLEKYSGSNDKNYNNEEKIKQELNLNWRVLDVKDGEVRLISEKPTESQMYLKGYNGYNNGVKLLDDICDMLYNNKFTSKVQNLKIEDIQNKMKEQDYTKFKPNYGKPFSPKNKYYPSILSMEEKQEVKTQENLEIKQKIGVSEQKELIEQEDKQQANVLNTQYTYYEYTIEKSGFLKNTDKYYELFMGKDEENYLTSYWLSSRCIYANDENAGFYIRCIYPGNISAFGLYYSNNGITAREFALRPVITLKSNIQVMSGEGTESKPFEIK